jgi:uncharacterized protein (TIGR02145 family)
VSSASASPNTGCTGVSQSVTFTATASAGNIYWYTQPTDGSSVHTGNYTVSLSASTTWYAEAHSGNCVSSSRTAVVYTANAVPNPGLGTTTPAVVCAGANYSISASGGVSYCFSTSSGACNQMNASTSGTFTMPTGANPSQTVYVTVRNAAGCTATTNKTITGQGTPTISLTSGTGSNDQSVTLGSTIAAISYTATNVNATGVTLTDGSFPDGVSGTWTNGTYTISGTPSGTGTSTYTLTTANSNGCTNATTTGTITVTAQTSWICGAQTWSSPVQILACDKSSYLNTPDAQCCSDASSGTKYYYYNWYYVNANKTSMCPEPWRVPTQTDFKNLDICLKGGGNAEPRTETETWVYDNYITLWGGSFAGQAVAKAGTSTFDIYDLNTVGNYWASTQASSSMGHGMQFSLTGFVYPLGLMDKRAGLSVRCVRTTN